MNLIDSIKAEIGAVFGRRAEVASSTRREKRKAMTKVERMLLVAAAAQVLAGPGKNPTREQVATAQHEVDRKLSGATSSSGSWSSGSFWSKVSNIAKGAGMAAVRAAPGAAKWAGQNPQILLPLAGAAIASPFLIKAISMAASSPQAQEEAATKPPPHPEGETVTVSSKPSKETPNEGPSSPVASLGWLIRGDLSEEEVASAESGGYSEREALVRLRGEKAISHDGYRAAVVHKAHLISGGAPTSKHVMLAEKAIKEALRRRGVRVTVPGARPSRRTL